ncbi:hypothetical protein ACJW30_10G073300 [Castanea mollissima]
MCSSWLRVPKIVQFCLLCPNLTPYYSVFDCKLASYCTNLFPNLFQLYQLLKNLLSLVSKTSQQLLKHRDAKLQLVAK